jgi:hypothetical protein
VKGAILPRQFVRVKISAKLLDDARSYGIDLADMLDEHLEKTIATRRAEIKAARVHNARNARPVR